MGEILESVKNDFKPCLIVSGDTAEMNQTRDESFSVLFVDDNQDIVDLGETVLEQECIEVDTTTNPEEAYRMFLENDYDAVISDFQMPEMTGEELYEEVSGHDDEIPFFVHTGSDLTEVAQTEPQECYFEYHKKVGGLESYRKIAEQIQSCASDYR